MKRILMSLCLGAAFLCQAIFAQNQTGTAQVPFPFKVGETMLPAGAYTLTENGSIVRVSETLGSRGLMHLTMPASRLHATDDGKLVFTRFEDSYYLTTIWLPGSTTGRTVAPSKHQRELMKQAKNLQIAEISFPSPLR